MGLAAESRQIFLRRPIAFLAAVILPIISMFVILVAIGRIIRLGLPAGSKPVDPVVLWSSFGVVAKTLWILGFIISSSTVRGIGAAVIALLTTDRFRQGNTTLGSLLGRTLRVSWRAAIIASMIGVLAFPGFLLVLVPGMMIEAVFAFAVIAATLEELGPFAALRRSMVLTKRKRLTILGLFLMSGIMLIAGQLITSGIVALNLAIGLAIFLFWVAIVGALLNIALVLMYQKATAEVAGLPEQSAAATA